MLKFELSQEFAAILLNALESHTVKEVGALYFSVRHQYETQIAGMRAVIDQAQRTPEAMNETLSEKAD